MSILNSVLKVFVGDKSKQDVKAIMPIVKEIKLFEPKVSALSHDELRALGLEKNAKKTIHLIPEMRHIIFLWQFSSQIISSRFMIIIV